MSKAWLEGITTISRTGSSFTENLTGSITVTGGRKTDSTTLSESSSASFSVINASKSDSGTVTTSGSSTSGITLPRKTGIGTVSSSATSSSSVAGATKKANGSVTISALAMTSISGRKSASGILSESSASSCGVVPRTDRVMVLPNFVNYPGAETGTVGSTPTGWGARTGTTVTKETAEHLNGAASAMSVVNTEGQLTPGPTVAGNMPAVLGQTVEFGFWTKVIGAQQTWRAAVNFLTSALAYVTGGGGTSVTQTAADGWQQYTGQVAVPATAGIAYAQFAPYRNNLAANIHVGDTAYHDEAYLRLSLPYVETSVSSSSITAPANKQALGSVTTGATASTSITGGKKKVNGSVVCTGTASTSLSPLTGRKGTAAVSGSSIISVLARKDGRGSISTSSLAIVTAQAGFFAPLEIIEQPVIVVRDSSVISVRDRQVIQVRDRSMVLVEES